MFGEVIPAALAADGSQYFNRSWRHAAGYVMSPPLRLDPTTPEYLTDLLAKWVLSRPFLCCIRPDIFNLLTVLCTEAQSLST